ncbi:MAG: hypothetical protein HQ538_06700 [Parcubacteria group bacterium]|nr:hypothetical protein [Parcubacteria group bacterium]
MREGDISSEHSGGLSPRESLEIQIESDIEAMETLEQDEESTDQFEALRTGILTQKTELFELEVAETDTGDKVRRIDISKLGIVEDEKGPGDMSRLGLTENDRNVPGVTTEQRTVAFVGPLAEECIRLRGGDKKSGTVKIPKEGTVRNEAGDSEEFSCDYIMVLGGDGKPNKIRTARIESKYSDGIEEVLEREFDDSGRAIKETDTLNGKVVKERIYAYNKHEDLTNKDMALATAEETRFDKDGSAIEYLQKIYTKGGNVITRSGKSREAPLDIKEHQLPPRKASLLGPFTGERENENGVLSPRVLWERM